MSKKLTFAEEIKIQIVDNSVEDMDGDLIVQEESFGELRRDIIEVVQNLLNNMAKSLKEKV